MDTECKQQVRFVRTDVEKDLRLDNYTLLYSWLRFSRGPVQTTLPPRGRRPTRLCAYFDDQIKDLEVEASNEESEIQERRRQKREAEVNLEALEPQMRRLKVNSLLSKRHPVLLSSLKHLACFYNP